MGKLFYISDLHSDNTIKAKCLLCKDEFFCKDLNDKLSISEHLIAKHFIDCYKCKYCQDLFITQKDIIEHRRKNHNKIKKGNIKSL